MTLTKTLVSIFAAAVLMLSLGCTTDGPMEQAGESMDNAATDMGNAVEDACEDATNEEC